MLRPALAAALFGALIGIGSPAPAEAATGDLLTVDRWQVGGATGDSARFIYADPTVTISSGSRVRVAGTTGSLPHSVDVSPPLDPADSSGSTLQRWVPGTTYEAADTSTWTVARLFILGVGTCDFPGTWHRQIHVDSATYDGSGTLTAFAGSFSGSCTTSATAESAFGGVVRIGSSAPWVSVRVAPPAVPPRAAYGDHVDATFTVSAEGTTSAGIGAPTIAGAAKADYTIVGNDCPTALAAGTTCTVTVRFTPTGTPSSGISQRPATLFVPVTGTPIPRAAAEVAGHAVTLPGAPLVRSFPTDSGIGLTWRDTVPLSMGYRVFRRPVGGGSADWVPIADVADGPPPHIYVDTEPAPSSTFDYAVAGVEDTLQGLLSVPLRVTRNADLPDVGPESSITIRSVDPAGIDQHWTTTDGLTASAGVGMLRLFHDPLSSADVTLSLGAIAGPGTYPIGPGSDQVGVGVDTWPQTTFCQDGGSLVVRNVRYDAAFRPLVLDASAVFTCPDQPAVRLDVHYASAGDVARLVGDPAVIEPLSSHIGATTAPVEFVVTNVGSVDASLGDAVVTGPAAADWAPALGTCVSGLVLAPGETCTVSAMFTPSSDHGRLAWLTVPVQVGGVSQAPIALTLRGVGGSAPGAVSGLATSAVVGRIGLQWQAPADDGGYPVLSYDVQRSADGGVTWKQLGQVGAGTTRFADNTPADGTTYSYRVRAVNEIGAGAWPSSASSVTTWPSAVITSVRLQPDEPRSLWMRQTGQGTATVFLSDGHDLQAPAVSLSGTLVAYARGASTDAVSDTYDVWTAPVRPGGAPVRVTSLPGLSTDPAWSPDQQSIAFTHRTSASATPAVWVVDADGGGTPRHLVDGALHPTWSSDGASLVVASPVAGEPLRTVSLSTGSTADLSATAGGSDPAVGPDGSIALIVDGAPIVRHVDGTVTAAASTTPDRPYAAPSWTLSGGLLFQRRLPSGHTYAGTMEGSGGVIAFAGADEEHPSWAEPDSRAPGTVIDGPALVGRSGGSWSLAPRDDRTSAALLRLSCRFDDGAWTPCEGSFSVGMLAAGGHDLHVRVSDLAGNVGEDHLYVVSDVSAPSVPAVTALDGRATMSASVGFSYRSTDATGVAGYDVRYRRAAPRHGFGSWSALAGWSGRVSRSVVVPASPGDEICVSARAHDAVGNVSAWSSPKCSARPMDDRSLKAAGGGRWHRAGGHASWLRTVTLTRSSGASLSVGHVSARRVSVLVTTCRSCGRLSVSLGGVRLGTVSLTSKKREHQQLRWLPVLRHLHSGRLRLTSLTDATVRVDGVVLRRT